MAKNNADRVWTVIDLIKWGTEYFREREIESPRLTMELCLCDVLAVTRIKLYSEFDRPLLPPELARLRTMVKRLAHNEPLQYVLGYANFYSLRFAVTPDVLIPRPETEFLVEQAIQFVQDETSKGESGAFHCLDIGTGSGCIAISIAVHTPTTQWTCADSSAKALAVASSNARTHGVDDRCTWMHGNILKSIPEGRFRLIVMNPPYIPASEVSHLDPNVRDYEPHQALTDDADGMTFYRWLSQNLEGLMEEKGLCIIELGHGLLTKVVDLFAPAWGVSVIEDLDRIPRIAVISRAGP
ncbi:MAG: peptide chain release factor N(5)-glutamine methyltransferase [Chlorobi bacterium]|nr:MAG: peptide chain release factor N(5)-glutamine methyltransferase [Bacteroidota bacterium]MBE2265510.1 peptide chain release factor N(5)-glutamine methyltransferase [Flavobacteriales bacterium]MBL1160678.1 peptide chain release factor N(5)-glutamine methyltransferase [Chlorobiota bacterium]MBZ0195393.1 peptide chain release factor N(5)-glutamine methyltransferase [Candidatus Kapabacteria bacterium]MCC6331482.1 peptide chain release factor N(5)-glutamine methyltransferase [Ignavibacteria bac